MVAESDVEAAIRTIIQWVGDDPKRRGLLSTPTKVAKSYKEIFSGYAYSAEDILSGYLNKDLTQQDLVIFRNIPFTSFCEHHILPFSGHVNIAYIPTKGIIGFDRVSRLVDMFARRLQLQERMTKEIADSLFKYLESDGVAVSIIAQHYCMSLIGSRKNNIDVYSEAMLGKFLTDADLKEKFISLLSFKVIYEK